MFYFTTNKSRWLHKAYRDLLPFIFYTVLFIAFSTIKFEASLCLPTAPTVSNLEKLF